LGAFARTRLIESRYCGARLGYSHRSVGDEFFVRWRIDGRIHPYCHLSHEVGHALLTQLKLMANLDIADPFHCKEGHLQLPEPWSDSEVRITTLRVKTGEAASLRLLQHGRLLRPLSELGLLAGSLDQVQRMLELGEGLILITGPSGSGKTTTAYSILQTLDDGQRNIVTIEEPVELIVPQFRQIEVDPRHGMTFGNSLRTLLRLDPDVVLLGEIRDQEAAEVALRAAISGKYALSTLHSRDVAAVVTALRNLGVDLHSLVGNLAGIISQRIVRRVCQQCCRAERPTDSELALFAASDVAPPKEVPRAVGCEHCHGSGYWERIGLFEAIMPAATLVRDIIEGLPEIELRSAIRSSGTPNLVADGLTKVREGLTTIEEVRKMAWIELL
jgi:type II secretory ATPase GspE/PulE/Tfp pilus assembly ATPase PilB-like protein